MSISPEDLATLRSKVSDDQIIEGLSKTDPTDAADIKTLQGKGVKNTQILDGFAKYHTESQANHAEPNGGFLDSAAKMGQGLAYGASQEAHMLGATAKAVGFNKTGDALHSLGDGANSAGGLLGDMSTYRPATADMGLDKSLWSNISSIPRAIVEGLPMVGGMAAAAAAAPEVAGAGLTAAGAYGLARNLGTTADERAANNGRSAPTTGDVVGALPGAALRGLVDAAGNRMLIKNGVLSPNPVSGAGLSAMGQTVANLGKATATNAVTGAASDAIGQAGSEIGTDKGYSPNVGQSLNAGVVGGLTAAGMKAVEAVPESITNYRLSGTPDPINRQVAADLQSNRITGDPSNPDDHERLVAGAKAIYKQDIAGSMKELASTAKEIDVQGGSVSHINDAMATAKDLMTNLQNGPLDASQVKEANDKLSGQPELLNQILKLNKINGLGEQSDVGKSGSPTAWDYLKAYKAYKAAAGIGLIVSGHPLVGGLMAAAPFALTASDKVKAALTGSSHLIGDFAQRFGGQGDPQGSQGIPGVHPAAEALQTPPENPHAGMLPAPSPRLALPRPPIYAGSDPSWSAHQGFQMEGEPYTPQEAPREPQAPLALPPPQRQLPAPPIYAHAPPKGFTDQAGSEMSNHLMMLRAAMQKAQGGNQEQAPAEAPPEPQAPQTPLQAPVDTKAVAALAIQRQRAMQTLAAKEFVARQKASSAPAPKEPAASAQPSFNDQANAIEKQLTDAKAVINDPTSSADAVAMAKAAVRRAALGAAAQHDASHGGSKGAKKAPAANASAAHNGKTSIGGSEHAGHTGAHVHPEMTHIHTSVGEKVQSTAHIRKSAAAVGQGVVKSRETRFQIANTAKHLKLSTEGKAHVGEAMEALKSKAESKATNNRAFGKAALAEALKGFNESDRSILQKHFDTALSTHEIRFLDSWTHATPEAKASADVKNAGFAKAKATIAAKKTK